MASMSSTTNTTNNANDYPVDYILDGYVNTFVSSTEKAWKLINYNIELKDEEPMLGVQKEFLDININNMHRYLTDDMKIPLIEKKRMPTKYNIFMKEYMEKSDKKITYKIRFKEAIEAWHLQKR